MRKTIAILAVLLAAQLLLAVGLTFTGPDLTAQRPDTPLLHLGDRAIDHLSIEGPDTRQVMLARQGDVWVLPESGDFPADTGRVDRLLERLQGLQRGMAVATTGGALKRFRVSDAGFERRVTLSQGDATVATLYFGTTPGMRRVHARTSEDDAVYTTEFGIHEVPLRSGDWEDKEVLQIPSGEISSIGLADLTLDRVLPEPAGGAAQEDSHVSTGQTGWHATELQDGETVNQAGADALAQQLSGLRIGSVLGREAGPEYGLETPALAVSVQRNGGERIEYHLGKRDREGDYVLKVSSRPEYFRLPDYTAEALITAAGREQLVGAETGAPEEAAPVNVPGQSTLPEGRDAAVPDTPGKDAS